MKNSLRKLFLNADIRAFRNAISKENRRALHVFALAGITLAVINTITQMFMRNDITPPLFAYYLPALFLILLLADRYIIPEDCPGTTLILYVFQSAVMILSILLGTVFDPTHQATTILLMLLFMPAFLMDLPLRSILFHTFWSLVFILACHKIKDPYLFRIDTVHIFEFLLASFVLTTIINRVRMNYMRKLNEMSYVIDHDPQTGSYSRQALRTRISRYTGKPSAIVVGLINNLNTYNDFYGHDAGQNILVFFSTVLSHLFGDENTYRYRGNEFFCVIPGGNEEDCRNLIEQCSAKLSGYEINGKAMPLTAGFGYVTGNASNEKEFRQMAQLADIHLHQALRLGAGQVSGGVFDEEHLRQGIIGANLSKSAPSYEINALTGLPGMSFFTVHSTELLNNLVIMERRPVIGYLKLMRLREFNTEFGYAGGDLLIADIAKLLLQAFDGRQVCYITAGKFCVMCYHDEVEPALRQVNEILETYKPGFRIYIIGGFAEYTGKESVISLLDRAKLAEHSIRRKKEVFCFFDHEMEEENLFRQYIISHVDEAIENSYIKVYYQPIARALTGLVCNEEALSRWDDPRYGFLMPFRFVPVLEENALMYKVNLYVVSQVLEDMKNRQELGVPVVPVSVNLSRTDFDQCDMFTSIASMVDASGFDRSILKIEITESAFIDDPDMLKREVERFRSGGFEVWLDDFGSEYSTLNLLQEIDFDLLKIDMKFMKNFSTEGKNFIIISDIIDMAKRMGITTLIEGIETKEHFSILQKLGCEKIQGYLFNRPNPHEYIIQRALSGTGLHFEEPEAAPYYEAIGRIDLKKPSIRYMSGVSTPDQDLPSAFLEWKDSSFTCLAATEPFRHIAAQAGWMNETEEQQKLIGLPEEMLTAAEKCRHSDGRFGFSITVKNHTHTVYLRRISEYEYKGAFALLAIIMLNTSS